jgi:oligopeptide/dipeptide ABC transporter ATP-binding protein
MSALVLRDVRVQYRQAGPGRRAFSAVDGVGFTVAAQEMLGLVGESGCGKTTLGRAILGLVPLAGGEVSWGGRRIDDLRAAAFRPLRRELQCVFQDPHACLDPRMTIAESVAEPLRALEPGSAPARRAARALERLQEVGIGTDLAARYPHQLSGGQLQRAVIARALVVDPRFVVCDEPVSALDVTVQGQVVALLERIRVERRLASLFISHNLAVVARLCERIRVMYRGRIVEAGARERVIRAPRHPYTRELLDAVPAIDAGARARNALRAARARPAADDRVAGSGCPFAARCPYVLARCRAEQPALRRLETGHEVACHRAGEWPQGLAPLEPA